MDLYSLGENSPVIIVRKKPFRMETGVLKSKGTKPVQQNIYIPQLTQQQMDIIISVNGNDEVLPGIKEGMEIAEYRNAYYCATQSGAQQVIASMMQMSSNELAEVEYHNTVMKDGEKYMEQLNPQYAEGKRQARTIEELVKHREETDAKLKGIERQNAEMLSLLKEICGSPKKKNP